MKSLARGDRIEVEWLDVLNDPAAHPDTAAFAHQKQIGYYWGPTVSDGIPALVITSYSNEDPSQDGFTIIPDVLVVSIRRLRKPSKKVSV